MLRGVSSFGTSGGGIGLKSTGVLAQSAVPASVTGTTVQTVLATISIPANTLGINGALRITEIWSVTNNANTKALFNAIGGVGTLPPNISLTTSGIYTIQYSVMNRGALNSQVFPKVTSSASGASYQASATTVGTSGIDFSAAQVLTMSAQLGVSTDAVTLEGYTIEVLNP